MSKPSLSSVSPPDAPTQDTPVTASTTTLATPPSHAAALAPIVPKLTAITPPPQRTGYAFMSPGLSNARWTGVWSCVPALLFLALAAGLQNTPAPPLAVEQSPVVNTRVAQETVATGVLPSSETMVVSARQGSGSSLMRAELQPTSQVTGQSPLSGQISRVLVRPGQFVDVNDRVLELSTGPTSRKPTGAEKEQNSAESAQVAAVQQQEALNKRMETARAQLNEAQVRVAAARHRLLLARQLVLKVQNGEAVQLPAATDKAADTPTPHHSAPRRHEAHDSATSANQDPKLRTYRLALQDAQHDAKKTQHAATQATKEANEARLAADAADQKVRLKQHELDEATSASDNVQDTFDSGQAKGSDVATARANESNAKAALTEAAASAAHAHQEAERLQTTADKLEDEAKHNSSRLAQAAQKMQLLAAASPSPSPQATTEPTAEPTTGHSERVADAGKTADLTAVAQYVHEAKAESETAVKNADRLKSEIDTYEKQVHSTTQRLDSTSKNLEAAQQTVVENTIHAGLSSVRAPASGVVLSVAEIAHDVAPGEPVVTIGRMDRLEARFEDYSGTWKNLKVGTLLPAVVREPATPPAASKTDEVADDTSDAKSPRKLHHRLKRHSIKLTSNATPTKPAPAVTLQLKNQLPGTPPTVGVKTLPGALKPAPLTTATPAPTVEGTPIRVRLTAVTPPTQPGAPAVLEVSIYNPRTQGADTADDSDADTGRDYGRLFHPGMTVLCSLQSPSAHEVVTVPANAVLQASDGTHLVAVLKPVESPAPTPGATSPLGAPLTGAALPAPAPAPGTVSPVTANSLTAPRIAALPGATPGIAPGMATATPPTLTPAEGAHRVEWRPVTIGKTEDGHLEIVDGLASGERIALEPATLHAFTLAHGPGATLRLSTS